MFRVLISSLFITNPLTLNLSPSSWVTRSFPIPLETIKHSGDFYFDLYKSSQSNGSVLNISTATDRSRLGGEKNNLSSPKLAKPQYCAGFSMDNSLQCTIGVLI